MPGPVGIVANPASGKDVRRLVARASVFDNREKSAIVRRALIGAVEAGAREFVYLPDSHNIAGSAIEEFDGDCHAVALDIAITATGRDTELAARKMKESGCAVVLILGGDGTSRAFAKGWHDAPLIALSTGTNNVFPVFAEATIAGAAAGLIGSGLVETGDVSRRVKIIHVEIDEEPPEIALIDAVASDEHFVGARALLDADALQCAVLTRAAANVVGISALGGLLDPLTDKDDCALFLRFGQGEVVVNAPIAPGLYQSVRVAETRRLAFDEPVKIEGACVLAFDGERERVLAPGQTAVFSVSRDGPAVVDIACTLALGAARGAFGTALPARQQE